MNYDDVGMSAAPILLLLLCLVDLVNSNGYSITPDRNENVLAIDTTASKLAILTRSRIYIYTTNVSINESAQYDGTSALPEPIHEDVQILDFKLLSDNEVAYCTAATCGLVDKNDNAATLLFDVDNERGNFTEIRVQSDTLGVPHISKQISVAGFSRGNCVYFVGTYLQNIQHFKWIDDNTSTTPNEHNTTLIKLTRSCFNASTSQIVSTLELNVDCLYYNSNQLDKVIDASYDHTMKELWLLSLKRELVYRRTLSTICRISMNDVDSRLDQDNIGCQRGSIYNKNENIRIFHNCNSKNYSQMDWPVDYNLFRGEQYVEFTFHDMTFTDVFVEPKYGDIFQAAKGEGNLEIFGQGSNHERFPIVSVPVISHLQRQIVGVSNDSLFYINTNSVVSVPISCGDLYETCESLKQGSSVCAWCSDEGNQRAVRVNDDNDQCQKPFLRTCPATNESEQTPASFSPVNKINSTLPDSTIPKLLTRSNETGEHQTDYIIVSVLGSVLVMLVVLVGLIMLQQANVLRQYRYNKERPKYSWQNARPLLASVTYDENTTPDTIISSLTSSSSQTKYDYVNLFKKIDEGIKIDMSCLQLFETIGEGNFGVVFSGTYTTPEGDIKKVACKMLRDGEAGVRAFLDEGLTMMQFEHARVIPFIGIALANDTDPIIVTKFMNNGNLLTYLQNSANTITPEQILVFSMQIAEGMAYLHSKKFIHRDLAARNCMLDYKMQLKIGDFGLARQCNNQNMYLSCKYPDMPFAWASIEALEFWTFTIKCDIWSYGVVLWELMSRGAKPYPKYNPNDLLKFLKEGGRLHRPQDCPEEFYTSIMMPCWDEDMNNRPSFCAIIELLQEFLKI